MTANKCRAKNPKLCPYHGNPLTFDYSKIRHAARENRGDVRAYSDPVVAKSFGWTPERVKEAKLNIPAYEIREQLAGDLTMSGINSQVNELSQQYNASESIFVHKYKDVELPYGSFDHFMENVSWEYAGLIPEEMTRAKQDLNIKKRQYEEAVQKQQYMLAYSKLKNSTASFIKEASGDENDTLFKKLSGKKLKQAIEQQEWVLKQSVSRYEKVIANPETPQKERSEYSMRAISARAVLLDIEDYKLRLNYENVVSFY